MAREYGRLMVSIWNDPAFVERTEAAQRLFALIISQPDVTYAGVLPYRPRRWTTLAKDSSYTKLRRSMSELEDNGLVLVDELTEEVLVRTFVHHDGILGVPNVTRAMVKAFRTILSPQLREVFLGELVREWTRSGEPSEHRPKGWNVIARTADRGGMFEEMEAAGIVVEEVL